jgi:hypothetical protein
LNGGKSVRTYNDRFGVSLYGADIIGAPMRTGGLIPGIVLIQDGTMIRNSFINTVARRLLTMVQHRWQ